MTETPRPHNSPLYEIIDVSSEGAIRVIDFDSEEIRKYFEALREQERGLSVLVSHLLGNLAAALPGGFYDSWMFDTVKAQPLQDKINSGPSRPVGPRVQALAAEGKTWGDQLIDMRVIVESIPQGNSPKPIMEYVKDLENEVRVEGNPELAIALFKIYQALRLAGYSHLDLWV